MSVVPISPELLSIVVCPVCHTRVAVDCDKSVLLCSNAVCGLSFDIRGGIPVLLVDRAHK